MDESCILSFTYLYDRMASFKRQPKKGGKNAQKLSKIYTFEHFLGNICALSFAGPYSHLIRFGVQVANMETCNPFVRVPLMHKVDPQIKRTLEQDRTSHNEPGTTINTFKRAFPYFGKWPTPFCSPSHYILSHRRKGSVPSALEGVRPNALNDGTVARAVLFVQPTPIGDFLIGSSKSLCISLGITHSQANAVGNKCITQQPRSSTSNSQPVSTARVATTDPWWLHPVQPPLGMAYQGKTKGGRLLCFAWKCSLKFNEVSCMG